MTSRYVTLLLSHWVECDSDLCFILQMGKSMVMMGYADGMFKCTAGHITATDKTFLSISGCVEHSAPGTFGSSGESTGGSLAKKDAAQLQGLKDM